MKVVLVLALVLGGCILGSDETAPTCGDGHVDPGEACDDGNDISDDGCSACVVDLVPRSLGITWTMRSAASPTPLACPAGFDTAEVVTQEVAADGTAMGAPRIDVFDCSDGGGMIVFDASRVALVQASVRITSGTGGTVYAESVPATVDLSAGDGDVAVAILTDGGYFRIGWTLRGAASGNELTCATVEPDSILVVSTGASSMFSDRFTCADGEGLTGALPAGTYDVSIVAEANDSPLGPEVVVVDATVQMRNTITALGTVEVPITGL